jgi:hypothetical protein
VFSDPFITITCGAATPAAFGAPIADRTWNGTVYYTPAASNGVLLANQTNAQPITTGAQTDLTMINMATNAFGSAQTINSITFTKTGTVPNASIGTIKLVHDVNNSGALDGGDTILGQGNLTGNTITFNSGPGFPIAVPTSGSPRLLLTVSSTANWAIGDNIEFSIANAASITWSGGTDYTTYPLSSGLRDIQPPQIFLGIQGSGNAFPFNFTAVGTPAVAAGRYQHIYDPGELTAIPAGSLIREIRVHGSAVVPPTFSGFELKIGHTSVGAYAKTNVI